MLKSVFQIHSSISGALGPVLLCGAQELEEGAVPNNPAEGHHLERTLHPKSVPMRAQRHRTCGREQGWLVVAELFPKACRTVTAFLGFCRVKAICRDCCIGKGEKNKVCFSPQYLACFCLPLCEGHRETSGGKCCLSWPWI